MWRKAHKTPQYFWDRNRYGPKLNYLFWVLPGFSQTEAEVVQNRQFIPTYTALNADLWIGLHSSTVRWQLMTRSSLAANFGPIYTFPEAYTYSLAGSPIETYSSFHMRALSHGIQCICGEGVPNGDPHWENSQSAGNCLKQIFSPTSENWKNFPLWPNFHNCLWHRRVNMSVPKADFPIDSQWGTSKINNSCSLGGLFPKFYGWPFGSVRVMYPNRQLIGPQAKIREGSKFSAMAMHGMNRLFALCKLRRCQRYFSMVEFPNLEFPGKIQIFGVWRRLSAILECQNFAKVPQFSSGFDFPICECRICCTVKCGSSGVRKSSFSQIFRRILVSPRINSNSGLPSSSAGTKFFRGGSLFPKFHPKTVADV